MSVAERPMKVLVVWELGANLGHLLRLRPVVQALKLRGHEVVMAVPEPDAARSLLDVAGVECIACPMVWPRGVRGQREREVRCYADILAEYAFGDGPALARTLGEWAALLDVVRPDAMLIEFAPLALLVARLHRLPAVHVAIGWEAPPAGDTLPLIRRGHPGDKEAAVALEAVLVGRINEHCAAATTPSRARAATTNCMATTATTTWTAARGPTHCPAAQATTRSSSVPMRSGAAAGATPRWRRTWAALARRARVRRSAPAAAREAWTGSMGVAGPTRSSGHAATTPSSWTMARAHPASRTSK